jgi:hypothetical protein
MVQQSNPFRAEGQWFRGNTHTHTTNSDGQMPPEKVVDHYVAGGYDYLFFTDHFKVTDLTEQSRRDFLILRGTEVGAPAGDGRSYHLIGLDVRETYARDRQPPVQEAVDFLRQQGALVIVAHPYWSGLTLNEILPLDGVTALEVYNATTETAIAKGYSMVHWDDVLSEGRSLYGVAVDDCHRPGFDSHRGWTMVKAAALTPEAIMQALRTGQFYCSTGPAIYDLDWEPSAGGANAPGGIVRVRCSPAQSISLVANASKGSRAEAGRFGESRRARRLRVEGQLLEGVRDGDHLTGAEFILQGTERFVRVQVQDDRGRYAWSNPLFVQVPD